LLAAGALAYEQGDLASAAALLEDALALSRNLQAQPELASVLFRLGSVARARGQLSDAHAHFTEACDVSRSIQQPALTALSLWGLGWVAYDEGKFAEARLRAEEGLRLATDAGFRRGTAILRALLGVALLCLNDNRGARGQLE
jgi:tetratricopeptide (TPR) repeat protein